MKKILKKLLRSFIMNVPIRGRHRMADILGKQLANEIEILNINDFNIQIDHSELFCRHMYYGIYEEPLIKFISKNIKEGDVVFDPGTNLGYITANCLKSIGDDGHIYSFEPSKTCYEILTEHNELDQIANLTLLNAAISNETKETFFYDTPRVIARGYACLEDINTPSDGIRYKLPAYSIDDFCSTRGIEQIKFLKLDIEGAELSALQGAQNLLSKQAIDLILVETTIDESKNSLTKMNNEIQDILEYNGYKSYSLSKNGHLIPIDLRNESLLRLDIIWSLN
ncbi:MAG: FkbM family methyltransferase [Bacteroidia bacterium]|nr:FkbM family methyltransferase [Bacteroidia bacterium]